MSRLFPELPSTVRMRPTALEWAAKRESYVAKDLKEFLAQSFNVTPAQRTLRFPKTGKLAFDNYVDWVTAYFTHCKIHTGFEGELHKNPEQSYCLTSYGRKLAQDAATGIAKWPPWRQYQRH